jgi:ParB/RepB/Spo0J family partition protein
MKRREEFDVYDLAVADIFYDASFNCRGQFLLHSVQELAESIEQNGLQFPAVVQPWEQENYKWRLVCGHRRFKAITSFLKWDTIPCCVRPDLSEHQARVLNLLENLERCDLNILEEATALKNIYPDGVSLRVASAELKRPTRWVHARQRLLDLPKEVQMKAAAGIISATNIETIYKLPTRAERIKAANEIERQKRKGKTTKLKTHGRKFQNRKRKEEIGRMIEHLWDRGLDGLPTRLLAWTQGQIPDDVMMKEIDDASTCAPGDETPLEDD